MKVLMSAYACDPAEGSEPGAGWAWARAAGLENEVWLLTRANNADVIDRALTAEPDLNVHPVYLDLPVWARWWKRGQRGVRLYYVIWQVLAWRAGRRIVRDHEIDVGHHVTMAVDWLPAGLAWVQGLPVIWGPVGGTTGPPWALWRWVGVRGLAREAAREVLTRGLRRIFGDPTARRAFLVVAQNTGTAARFVTLARSLRTRPNVALDLVPTERLHNRPSTGRRAVFSGRLLPRKGVRLAVATLAEPQAQSWSLDIFGDGPERAAVERLAARLGVQHRVRFHGWTARSEVLRSVATADAFLFPSMYEGAPWSVAEAVALGCPVVCLDHGGAQELIGLAGRAVPPRGDVTAALADALADLPRCEPDDRWSADRLPGVLAGWYGAAAHSSENDARFEEVP